MDEKKQGQRMVRYFKKIQRPEFRCCALLKNSVNEQSWYLLHSWCLYVDSSLENPNIEVSVIVLVE